MAADNEVNAKLNFATKEAVAAVRKLADVVEDLSDETEDAEDKLANFGEKLSSMGGKLQGVGAALSVGVTAPIVGIAGAALNMGIQAVESEALFEESFQGMADSVREWSLETSDALGLNEFELRRQSATIFTMTSSMGLSSEAARDMAQGITVLAGDMASFFNTSPEEAFNKLRSGITGEAEPLKQLGILVTENFIKQTDFAQAILATGRELTEQEKVMARYAAILDQTQVAQGDLARTSDSAANRIRRMGSDLEEAGTKLGLALIPALELVLPILEKMIEFVEDTVEAFAKLDPASKNVVIGFVGAVAAIGPLIGILGTLVTGVGFAITSIAGAGGITVVLGTMGAAVAAVGVALATFVAFAGAAFIGFKIGEAVGLWIERFLVMNGVMDSASDKADELAAAMEPTEQEIRAMAQASIIAGEEITNWKEATVILRENIEKMQAGTEDAIDVTGQLTVESATLAAGLEAQAIAADALAVSLGVSAEESILLAQASVIAGEDIKDFGKAAEIVHANLLLLRTGAEGAVDVMAAFAQRAEESAAAAEKLAQEAAAVEAAEAKAAAATKAAAEASKAAASARIAEAKAAQTLATSLGTSGLVGAMEKTNAALEVLAARGEKLAGAGLDKVIKQVRLLKDESIPLEGALKAWDERVKTAGMNLPRLTLAMSAVPLELTTAQWKELNEEIDFGADPLGVFTDEMIQARQGMNDSERALQDFTARTDVFSDAWLEAAGSLTNAQRAMFGLPPILKEGASSAELFSTVLQDTANSLAIFGISADSAIGQLVGLTSGFIAAIPAMTDFNKSILGDKSLTKSEKFAGVASGLASGISAVASATSRGGAARAALGGAIAGAQAGAQIGGPIGAGVGAAAGAIVGFFRGRGRDKIRKAVSDAVGADVSEDLSQTIKDAAKEAGNTIQQQSLLSLGDIFRDVGVDEFREGANGAAEAVSNLMKQVAEGAIPAKEGILAIGDAFTELVSQTFEAGKVADAGLIQLVKNARELGQDVPEIAAFVESQLAEAAQGISKVIGGIQIVNPQDAQDQATIFASTFFATVSEVGLLAAVDAFGPAFEELKKQLQDVGIEGTDFGGVGRLFEIAGKEEFRPLLEGVEGLNQGLVGLANSGFLTADSFSAFQRQGESAFEQLQAAGLTQNESLQQMAPFLQSAIDAAERFGIPLDENTQKLITQAEAAGIAFETDPMNRMADALVLVAELLGATEEQLSSLGNTAGGVADTMVGIGDNIAGLPDIASESVNGIQEAFAAGSEGIVEGLAPIAETMANEIRAAGEETSSAIDASFKSTNEAIRAGLSEVSQTFIGEVAPAALAAARATDQIAAAARRAAEAARSISFPDGSGSDGAEASAAAGFRGVLGADTLIQAHRGEFVNIIPADATRRMDFVNAQNGMGPGIDSTRMGDIDASTNITFVASGDRREDDKTVDKLIKELSAENGKKLSQLQRLFGVRASGRGMQ